jgi:hypothetical protein
MPGRGPAPKDPRRRARGNQDPIPTTHVVAEPLAPMQLPDDLLPDGDTWHPATLRWWQRWCDSPLAANLPAVDWAELEACAVMHHAFMKKRTFNLAAELRLRMAKFGATPEDRARLRIQLADADAKDSKRPESAGSASRERYGPLRAVAGGESA